MSAPHRRDARRWQGHLAALLPGQILPARIALLGTHQIDQKHTSDKAAHMSEKGRPPLRDLRIANSAHAAEKLNREPIDQHEPGGDVKGSDKKENECQSA